MKKIDIKKMPRFKDVLKKSLKDPEFRREYKALEVEDQIIRAIIQKRITEGMTQKKLAQKVGTTQSAIARFEREGINPSFDFVQKIARAVGVRIAVVPQK